MRVLLVGGGVTNSLISYFLKDSKIKFTCWEKARGLGGRFATKRNKDGLKADHGAQVSDYPDPAAGFLPQTDKTVALHERYPCSNLFQPYTNPYTTISNPTTLYSL